MSVEVKWENFMIAHKNRELQKTVSVENLLSLFCGIFVGFPTWCN